MANRPPGGPPEEGTPEYDWLYGTTKPGADDGTQAIRQSASPHSPAPRHRTDRDDRTRILPAQPAAESGRGSDRGSDGGPGRGSGSGSGRGGGRGGGGSTTATAPSPPNRETEPPRRRRPMRVVWVLLALWLVFLAVAPVVAWGRIDKVNALPAKDRPAEQPGRTYLLVGSDSRADLTPEERKRLGTGGDVGQRTDTIMLLHVGAGPDLLMSIPRDSLVDIADHGTTKINAAYAYGGPKLLVRTVEQNTGIRIDNYVEIGFLGVVDMVDAVGGVTVCPETAMKDKLAKLNIKKGCQEVDGATALGYARSRHTSNLGDLKRAEHQREVVNAVGKKALSPWTFINPVRYWSLGMAAADSFRIDDGTGPIALARFGLAMTRVGSKGLTCGVPISDMAVHWDPERSKKMFTLIREDRTSEIGKQLCTASGLAPR